MNKLLTKLSGIKNMGKLYEEVKDDVWDSNWKNMKMLSVLAFVAFGGLAISALFSDYLEKTIYMYGVLACLALICLILSFAINKGHLLVKQIVVFTFLAILLGFGIVMGTIIHPEDITVSFIVMMIAVPLLMTTKPRSIAILLLASIVVYLALAIKYQTGEVFIANIYDVIPYGVISILVSYMIMDIKLQRSFYKTEAERLAYSDQLTGCKNRQALNWAYQGKFDVGTSLGIYVLDVNGLKNANDNFGHEEGDKLIKNAANVLASVLGSDNVYRMGGDEFLGLQMNIGEEKYLETLKLLRVKAGDSASIGGTYSKDISEGFDSLVRIADKAMYDEKAAFYTRTGRDRRVN